MNKGQCKNVQKMEGSRGLSLIPCPPPGTCLTWADCYTGYACTTPTHMCFKHQQEATIQLQTHRIIVVTSVAYQHRLK